VQVGYSCERPEVVGGIACEPVQIVFEARVSSELRDYLHDLIRAQPPEVASPLGGERDRLPAYP